MVHAFNARGMGFNSWSENYETAHHVAQPKEKKKKSECKDYPGCFMENGFKNKGLLQRCSMKCSLHEVADNDDGREQGISRLHVRS